MVLWERRLLLHKGTGKHCQHHTQQDEKRHHTVQIVAIGKKPRPGMGIILFYTLFSLPDHNEYNDMLAIGAVGLTA